MVFLSLFGFISKVIVFHTSSITFLFTMATDLILVKQKCMFSKYTRLFFQAMMFYGGRCMCDIPMYNSVGFY